MRLKGLVKTFIILILLPITFLLSCKDSPSAIATEEATRTQEPTATIPVPTPTIHPTETDPRTRTLRLLSNNGNCRLPCIWGLTPGSTSTAERQKILAPYEKLSDTDISLFKSDETENPGYFGFGVSKNKIRVSVSLHYYETNNHIEILSLLAIPQHDAKYVYGNADYLELIEYYTLPNLLSTYGLPSEVLILAFPYDIFSKADYEVFSIVVIYSDLGIMAEYISLTQWIGEMVELTTPGLWVGEIARGCPSQSRIRLNTWDVKKNIPIKEITSISAGEGISANAYDYFVPIQKALSMSLNDFYNKYKEPSNDKCIELPSSLWIP